MGTYNKEKHMQVELQNVTKENLKQLAKKERRSVNNWVNIAIEEYKKVCERDN